MLKHLLLFFLIGTMCLLSQAEWVTLQRDSVEGSVPQIKVLFSNENQVIVEVEISGFYRDPAQDKLWKVNLPESATTEEMGRSSLPIVSGLIAVPVNTIHARIANYQILESVEFQGMQAYPFQAPMTDEEETETFAKDESHYQDTSLYPQECLMLSKIATWRNQKIVSFRWVPIQVRPGEASLLVNRKVRFSIDLEQGRTDFVFAPYSSEFEVMHQKMIVNYTPSLDSRGTGKYLVICEDSLISAIVPLVDWRKSQGYDTQLVPLSQVGNTATSIKAYLTQAYANGLNYVLLVGDPSKLPLYIWDGRYPSDYWYSCLAGDDLFADVGLGRICALTPLEVQTYVRKIQAYETSQTSGEAWITKALLISHKEGAPGKYQGCLEELRNTVYQYKVEFKTRHGSQSSSNNSTVKEDIDAGVAIVTYRGHGSTTSWSGWNGSNFSTDNMKSLNNSVYPVFYSIACNTGEIDSATETLAESCLKHPVGGGCAFLGATRPSYTVPNHDFCKFLFAATYTNGIVTIGNVSNWANTELLKKYGVNSYAATNVKIYLWLGDPCTSITLTNKKFLFGKKSQN